MNAAASTSPVRAQLCWWWWAPVAGIAFGALTSVLNQVSNPYNRLGAHIDSTPVVTLLGRLASVVGVGWFWAAAQLAVTVIVFGALTRAGRRPAWRSGLAGALFIVVATWAYYPVDRFLRNGGWSTQPGEEGDLGLSLLFTCLALAAAPVFVLVAAAWHRVRRTGLSRTNA